MLGPWSWSSILLGLLLLHFYWIFSCHLQVNLRWVKGCHFYPLWGAYPLLWFSGCFPGGSSISSEDLVSRMSPWCGFPTISNRKDPQKQDQQGTNRHYWKIERMAKKKNKDEDLVDGTFVWFLLPQKIRLKEIQTRLSEIRFSSPIGNLLNCIVDHEVPECRVFAVNLP